MKLPAKNKLIRINEDVAWAAGLFEGEGCAYIMKELDKRSGKYYSRAKLIVVMTDKDAVEKFRNIVGYGEVNGPHRKRGKDHWKDTWRWQVTAKEDVTNILNLFMPFLCERRKKKAEEILKDIKRRNDSWVREKRGHWSGKVMSHEIREKMKISQRARRLKEKQQGLSTIKR